MTQRKSRYFDIERSNQEGRSEARQHSERDEDGQQRDVPARQKAVPQHQAEDDREVDHEINQRDDGRGGRDNQAREKDLVDQISIANEAVRGFAEDRRKQEPRQHAGKHHNRIGHGAGTRQFGDPAECHGEDHHRQKRPDHRPSDADDGLLVAHGDIAPIMPPGPPRFEHQHLVVSQGMLAHSLPQLSRSPCSVARECCTAKAGVHSF